jgi:HPt (histidine-containing phosphotransfer) domain-containing protein
MKSALRNGEYVIFKELAHSLKGSSGNLGAEELFKICREISRLDQADLKTSAEQLLKDAQDSFESTRNTMIRYLEAPQKAIWP